jgi:hypothetical protein
MYLKLAVPVMAAVSIIGASIFTATPGAAQQLYWGNDYPYRHHYYRDYRNYRGHPGYRDYSGYMDPSSPHYDPQFQRNRENFGFSGRDPSRVGGIDPSLNPPGMGR